MTRTAPTSRRVPPTALAVAVVLVACPVAFAEADPMWEGVLVQIGVMPALKQMAATPPRDEASDDPTQDESVDFAAIGHQMLNPGDALANSAPAIAQNFAAGGSGNAARRVPKPTQFSFRKTDAIEKNTHGVGALEQLDNAPDAPSVNADGAAPQGTHFFKDPD